VIFRRSDFFGDNRSCQAYLSPALPDTLAQPAAWSSANWPLKHCSRVLTPLIKAGERPMRPASVLQQIVLQDYIDSVADAERRVIPKGIRHRRRAHSRARLRAPKILKQRPGP
jgi:hypothetical protein